jgi:iron complex outermembrane receptor protein
MPSPTLRPLAAALLACCAGSAAAQSAQTPPPAPDATLPTVNVTGTPSVAKKNQIPSTSEGLDREQIDDTVNVVNTEDALKYLPSSFVRKRHIGDTQAPLATRTSGVGASARSLIYADGVLLSPLIANNNTIGGPRWGMVAPSEIERIDMLYGPFSAAYAGNSIGSVVEITTRMPQKFEAEARVQESWQSFNQYGTHDSYKSTDQSLLLGNRSGDFAWWLSANHLDTHSQPLAYATVPRSTAASGAGTPVTGAIAENNRTGSPIWVVGAAGLEHQIEDNFKFKLAYDFSPAWRATYSVGLFQNNTKATAQSYLSDAGGAPVYSGSVNINGTNVPAASFGASTFSSNVYNFTEQHVMQSFSLKSNTHGNWDWEAIVSNYNYGQSVRRAPSGALPVAAGGGPGTIEYLNGTGWSTADLKGYWRPAGKEGAHQVSFGAHLDRYVLEDPKYNTGDWIGGGNGSLATDSRGKTQTAALWAQDAWRFAPMLKATVGGRFESWRAYDGYNYAFTPALMVNQPGLSATRFSPKGTLAWELNKQWTASASLAKAYRFPTVSELYQSITTGATITVPNPNLKPENATSSEIALERIGDNGRVRVSLFQEDLKDALIAQTAPLVAGSTTLFSFVQNIEKVRSRGVEVVADQYDVLVKGLQLTGSITYVDSRILQDAAYQPAVGKITPQLPTWRATLAATYRPNDKWTGTVAARYSGRQYSQIDNFDGYSNTFQGFGSFLVVDTRLRYQIDPHWSAAAGVDNLGNDKYFIFHPFPQRTVFAELRYRY